MKKRAWIVVGLIILACAFALSLLAEDGRHYRKERNYLGDGQQAEYFPAQSLDEIRSELGICALTDSPLQKDECYMRLSATRPHKDICPLILDIERRDICYENVASLTLNQEVCNLSSSGKIQKCKEQYILAKVFDSKDASLCDMVLDSTRKETCLNLAVSD